MGSESVEALVLGAMDYGEADRIVTLFTLEHGKVKGIARGAKKSVRRFGSAFEPFARLKTEIVLKEGLSVIRQADIVTVFPRIREDLLKIGYGGYACELADVMLPEGMANPRLFRLLSSYLEQLDSSPANPSDRRFFEMNLLNVLGYCPSLEQCVACGKVLDNEGRAYHWTCHDGLLCSRCSKGGKSVSGETLTLLRQAIRTGRFGVILFPEASLQEAGRILDGALSMHLHRPLKALGFLREMECND